jgi:hypothetical protein
MDFADIPADKANAGARADALVATTILRTYEQLDSRGIVIQSIVVLANNFRLLDRT